ncbi:MAG: metalloregulator ArsR/SmtB family transcription factor [Solirubrobacterales bacterium]
MQQALNAIAEPRRREILELVRDRELPAGEIAGHFTDVSRTAISQHLTVLREAGLVNERRAGTSRLYSVRREGLSEVQQFIEGFWKDSLERLSVFAEAEERRKAAKKEQ